MPRMRALTVSSRPSQICAFTVSVSPSMTRRTSAATGPEILSAAARRQACKDHHGRGEAGESATGDRMERAEEKTVWHRQRIERIRKIFLVRFTRVVGKI